MSLFKLGAYTLFLGSMITGAATYKPKSLDYVFPATAIFAAIPFIARKETPNGVLFQDGLTASVPQRRSIEIPYRMHEAAEKPVLDSSFDVFAEESETKPKDPVVMLDPFEYFMNETVTDFDKPKNYETDAFSSFNSESAEIIEYKPKTDFSRKIREAYDLSTNSEIRDIYNMPGMSLGRMARDAGVKRNDILDAIAQNKEIGQTYKWNRNLAERAGDMEKINEIVKNWSPEYSARDISRQIKEQTGFEISNSTIYRMRKKIREELQ